MTTFQEYHPSLSVSDYHLGEVRMFLRNLHLPSWEISSQDAKGMGGWNQEGGIAPDEGWFDEEELGEGKENKDFRGISGRTSGLAPDEEEEDLLEGLMEDEEGGLAPDDEEMLFPEAENGSGWRDEEKKAREKKTGERKAGRMASGIPETEESPQTLLRRANREARHAGFFSYEAGYIIGVNPKEARLYVQFEDSKPGRGYIYKAGCVSTLYDSIEERLRTSGQRGRSPAAR